MSEFILLCRINFSKFNREYCIIGISCISLSALVLFFSVFALYKMCRFYRHIKFENLVISGGIIELLLIILSVLTYYEIIIEISNFFQIFISLYIIRRLVRIVRKQFLKANIFGITKQEPQFDINKYIEEEDNEESKSEVNQTVNTTVVNQTLQKDKLHNVIFISLSIVNILLCIVNIVCIFIEKDYFIDLALSIYSLGIGILLVVLGVKVISKMKKANDEMKRIESKNVIYPIHSETFFKFRKFQLFIIIFTNLFCSGYQLFFFFGKYSFHKEHIKREHLKIYPLTLFGFVMILCVEVSNILIVLANLISFYCVIYKQFQTPKDIDVNKIIFSQDEIEKHSEKLVNDDINDYLKKSMAKNRDKPAKSFITVASSFSNANFKNN